MFVMLQFPFIDLRYIMLKETYQLNVIRNMDFNIAKKGEFVRGCGPIVKRNNSKEILEPICCSSNNAFAFNSYSIGNQLLFEKYFKRIRYKRIFTDKIACKFEIGFDCHKKSYTFSQIIEMVEEVYKSKISVKDILCEKNKRPEESRKTNVCKLENISKLLKDYYLFSTMKAPSTHFGSLKNQKLIQFGNPITFIELDRTEINVKEIPKEFHIKEIKEWHIVIYYCEKENLWLILKNKNSKKDIIRNFRIYLDKFLQQAECLNLLLMYISENNNTHNYNKSIMESFVKHYLKTFLVEDYYGLNNKEIIDILFELKNITCPNFKVQLLEKFAGTFVYDVLIEIIDKANKDQIDYLQKHITELFNEVNALRKIEDIQLQNSLNTLIKELININNEIKQGNLTNRKSKIDALEIISVGLAAYPVIADLMAKTIPLIRNFFPL